MSTKWLQNINIINKEVRVFLKERGQSTLEKMAAASNAQHPMPARSRLAPDFSCQLQFSAKVKSTRPFPLKSTVQTVNLARRG